MVSSYLGNHGHINSAEPCPLKIAYWKDMHPRHKVVIDLANKKRTIMKKYFFFAALAIVLAGAGMMHAVAPAHAQTMTTTASPADRAALQQQLDVAKATLINLEMQHGINPTSGDSQLGVNNEATAQTVAPAATALTASQVSAFQNTLSALAATLGNLSNSLGANPNLTASQNAAIAATLSGMKDTLGSMAIAISNAGGPASSPAAASAASPIAQGGHAESSAPSVAANTATGTAQGTGIAAAAPATTPAVTNTVQATAQASSIWSFTKAHWPAIVIIVLVIAILAILFWPEKGEGTKDTNVNPAPKAASPVSTAVAAAPSVTAPADSTKVA